MCHHFLRAGPIFFSPLPPAESLFFFPFHLQLQFLLKMSLNTLSLRNIQMSNRMPLRDKVLPAKQGSVPASTPEGRAHHPAEPLSTNIGYQPTFAFSFSLSPQGNPQQAGKGISASEKPRYQKTLLELLLTHPRFWKL